jgi:hypothetical protein
LAGSQAAHEPLLRAAFSDEDKEVRLCAALAIETWDRTRAIEALENLIVDSGGIVVRPMTMTAALAVPGSAGLCLYNIDRPDRAPSPETVGVASGGKAVPGADLDAAEAVYGAVMSGGLDHAYAICGPLFDAAASAFLAVGAPAVADALGEAWQILETGHDLGPPSLEERERVLARLSAPDAARIQALGEAFADSDLQGRLDCAVER